MHLLFLYHKTRPKQQKKNVFKGVNPQGQRELERRDPE
jgi:hypothetical protein